MSFECDLLAFSGPRLIFVRGQESSSGPGTRFLSVPILLSGEAGMLQARCRAGN